eukprot:17426-Pyramimonas_sp.AAC.1
MVLIRVSGPTRRAVCTRKPGRRCTEGSRKVRRSVRSVRQRTNQVSESPGGSSLPIRPRGVFLSPDWCPAWGAAAALCPPPCTPLRDIRTVRSISAPSNN